MMKLKGSYTVEAALLMAVVIPLLAGIIYLGFYLHNDAMMQNLAYEMAVLESLRYGNDAEETVEERRREITSQAFLGLEDVQTEVITGKKKVTAKLHGTFRVPGIVMRFFCNNQMEIYRDAELALTNPGETITRIHLMKKLLEEGRNGSNVSP